MDVQQLLAQGKLAEARASVESFLQTRPDKSDQWVFLAALDCLVGDWDAASRHLDTAGMLGKDWKQATGLYQKLLKGEASRRAVFAGTSKPTMMGEPPPWLAWLAQSLILDGTGDSSNAILLRGRSVESRPSFAATVNGTEVSGLLDADPRIGASFEVIIEGTYYWLPFSSVESVTTQAPKSLIDLVWLPASIRLSEGAEVSAHIPVRYPGSERDPRSPIQLSRLTDWVTTPGGEQFPVGQRLYEGLGFDAGILECRQILFPPSPSSGSTE